MKSLAVGIVVQLVVILSTFYLFDSGDKVSGEKFCQGYGPRGARRGVLIFSQGLDAIGGRARGHLVSQTYLFQTDEAYEVLDGRQNPSIVRSLNRDNILSGVDTVVYAGPSAIFEYPGTVSHKFEYTYPKSHLSNDNFRQNDEFVFEAVEKLIELAKHNSTVGKLLSRKVLFIVYFTSVTVANLKYGRDNSSNERNFIKNKTRHLEKLIETYYSDESTVYISLPQKFIGTNASPTLSVWGRGASKAFSSDVKHVDVCPLLASLLGIGIPFASVGRLPSQYLNMSSEEGAVSLACNAFQLHSFVFGSDMKDNISQIEKHLQRKEYNKSNNLSESVIRFSLSRMYLTKNCFDIMMYFLVGMALFGWLLFLITATMVVPKSENVVLPRNILLLIIGIFIFTSFVQLVSVLIKWSSPANTVIMHISLYPWLLFSVKFAPLMNRSFITVLMNSLQYIFFTLLSAKIFAFVLTGEIPIIFLIVIFVHLPLISQFRKTPFVYSIIWYGSCTVIFFLLGFPKFVMKSKLNLINIATTFWLCYGQGSVFFFDLKHDLIISQLLVLYMAVATVLANASVLLHSIPDYMYYLFWSLLTALIFPLFGEGKILNRLIQLSLSFGPTLLLLSMDYESVCYNVIMMFALCWVFLEKSFMNISEDHWPDLRRALLLLASCYIGYLLLGTVQENNLTILKPVLPVHYFWNDSTYYFIAIFYKYFAIFVIVMVIYISLIMKQNKQDLGIVYGLIILEMICLQYYLQLWETSSLDRSFISDHIFINVFALMFMMSYYFGVIFSINGSTQQKNTHPMTIEKPTPSLSRIEV